MENNHVTQFDAHFQRKLDVWTSHAVLYEAHKEGLEETMLKIKGHLTSCEKKYIEESAINYARKTRVAEAKMEEKVEAKMETALKTLADEMPIELIVKYTKLTKEEIEQLNKQ